ncbi:HMA2 domain-containing protein [Thioalkalivibrio sp.]|uniref:HMA2 domain-containing protein n=1 Tax=Thioalkalivibrio sp. TaxID=2093813 RepID=UPI003563BC06
MFQLEGVKVKWILPGRVTLRIDDLIGKPGLAESLKSDIAPIDGVKQIKVDADSGTVTLRYDRKRIGAPDSVTALLAALRRNFPNRDFSSIESWARGGKA